jgi:hypothetical protein
MTEAEPRDIEDADEGDEYDLGAFPLPPLDECPVVFLGFYDGRVVFAMPEGEIREEAAAQIGRLIKIDIFNGVEGQSFLQYWRDRKHKFQRDLATIWFIRQCREAGYWDRSRPQRGLGVWPGEDGDVILHRGHELWTYAPGGVEIGSVAETMRERVDGPIYRLRPTRPAPEKPTSLADGQWARAQLDLWRFEDIGADGLTGADVLAGWLMCALLGAVAPFRPHMLMHALLGSGKTTLVFFVHGLLSALAGDVIDSFSPAGLKNDLAGMARPVIIDEAEASAAAMGPGPVEQAMELLRRMATGEGGVRKQGDVGGGTVTQTAVGAVLMAAVNPVKLNAADASRVAEVRLLPLSSPMRTATGASSGMASDGDLITAREKAKTLAPALLGRALAGAGRYLADVTALKAALLRGGHSPRASDLVAALAAGRRLLLADDVLDDAAADEEAKFWRGMLEQRESVDTVRNPGADCLAHLFSWPSGQHVQDRVVSLGELVEKWAKFRHGEVGDYVATLMHQGLRVYERGGEPWLVVANQHPVLERIFERTRWPNWRSTLAYLDALGPEYETRPTETSVRFGVTKSRGIAIPLAPWLERDRSGDRSGQDHDE